MKRNWQPHEVEFLKKHYPVSGIDFCADKLGRTRVAVKTKAQQLKVRCNYRLTSAQKTFIRKNIDKPYAEIAVKLQIETSKVKRFVHRHKLNPKQYSLFSTSEDAVIRDNYIIKSWKEVGEMLGRTSNSVRKRAELMGLKRTKKQLRAIMRRTAGHTRFMPGQQPNNTRHNGAISDRTDTNGNTYRYIRISPNNWQMLHVVNWEKANGPVPEGKILVCKNGKQLDCRAANWEPIDRATNLSRNNHGRDQLEDGYIVSLLTRNNRDLRPLIAAQPELIELKRNQLKLERAIKNENTI